MNKAESQFKEAGSKINRAKPKLKRALFKESKINQSLSLKKLGLR